MDMGCPEGIERTNGDMSQVQGGRAGTTDGLRYLDSFDEVQQVSGVASDVCWQADSNERFGDSGNAAGSQLHAVAPGTPPLRRSEAFVAKWLVNHASLDVVPAGNCDGNREIRVTMNV